MLTAAIVAAPLVRWASLGEALPACLALEAIRIVVPVKQPTEIHATFPDPEHDPRLSLFRGIFTPIRRKLREVTVRLDSSQKMPVSFRVRREIQWRRGVAQQQTRSVALPGTCQVS